MIVRKETKNGLFYFLVKAPNGKIIASSEKYSSKMYLENAIESLKSIVQKEIFKKN